MCSMFPYCSHFVKVVLIQTASLKGVCMEVKKTVSTAELLPSISAWIMERYAVTVDKSSGIVDDPNTYKDLPKDSAPLESPPCFCLTIITI